MLETTQSINLFIPMMISILVSRAVGNLYTRSLYERALRAKQMPVLRNNPPESTSNTKASMFMSKSIVTLPSVADMDSIRSALESTHSAFPVLNTAGILVGLIPKHVLVILLERKAFYT